MCPPPSPPPTFFDLLRKIPLNSHLKWKKICQYKYVDEIRAVTPTKMVVSKRYANLHIVISKYAKF